MRLNPPISVGAMASPEKKITPNSTGTLGSAHSGATPTTMPASVMRNLRCSGARQRRAPYHSPPVALPSA